MLVEYHTFSQSCTTSTCTINNALKGSRNGGLFSIFKFDHKYKHQYYHNVMLTTPPSIIIQLSRTF
jgi:hypothetical protein